MIRKLGFTILAALGLSAALAGGTAVLDGHLGVPAAEAGDRGDDRWDRRDWDDDDWDRNRYRGDRRGDIDVGDCQCDNCDCWGSSGDLECWCESCECEDRD